LDGLWIRGSDRELEGESLWAHYAEQASGPVIGGVFLNWIRAADKAADGHVYRAFEQALPKFAKDAMKSGRFGAEGALTLRSKDAIKDDFTPWELISQAMGFTPLELRQQYSINSALKGYERHIYDRRSELLTAMAISIMDSNVKNRAKINREIRAFNSKYPELAITTKTIKRSVRRRYQNKAQSNNGVQLNPKLKQRLTSAL
jgi:hypothetical protein